MPSPSAGATSSGSRATTCPRCGTAFTCNLSDACWCSTETAKLPMPVSGEDCLCASCLRSAAAQQPEDR